MTIQISKHISEDRSYQRHGHFLANRLSTEDEVIESLRDAIAKRSKVERTGLASAAPALCIGFYIVNYIAAPMVETAISIIGLILILLSIACFWIWPKMDRMVRLHDPISSHGHLCTELTDLASHSPAVAEAIRCATRSGRQLRLFDVARVNRAYSDEKSILEREYQDEACRTLHSM